jgi:hypothetical protein
VEVLGAQLVFHASADELFVGAREREGDDARARGEGALLGVELFDVFLEHAHVYLLSVYVIVREAEK